MEVHNTTDWPAEKLLPYGPEITRAFHKLRDRFPREVDIQTLFEEITTGKRQLWLILDDDGKFLSFVLTAIQIEPTGEKTLVIPSLAGDEGASTVHMIDRLEAFGRENGCNVSSIVARKGWTKPFAEQGYKPEMVVFRKAL